MSATAYAWPKLRGRHRGAVARQLIATTLSTLALVVVAGAALLLTLSPASGDVPAPAPSSQPGPPVVQP